MNTETILYICIALAGIFLLFFLTIQTDIQSKTSAKKTKAVKREQKKPKPQPEILMKEIFDYGEIKILNDHGIYTVNNQGRVMTYKSWRYLPVQFQKMVKQVDSGTLAKSKSGYFIDNINGVYYLTTPNGKKKKFNSLNEIPQKIRDLL